MVRASIARFQSFGILRPPVEAGDRGSLPIAREASRRQRCALPLPHRPHARACGREDFMAPARPFTVNPVLTGIAVAFVNPDTALIADEVMPRVEVGGESFKWSEYPLEEGYTLPATLVGRKGRVPEVEFSATERPASVSSYGLQDAIPNSDIDVARAQREQGLSSYDPLAHATTWLTHLLRIDREMRVAATVQNPTSYAPENVIDITQATDRFDDPDSEPEALIDTAMDAPKIIRPNTIAMSDSVWKKVRKHPKLVRAVKGATTGAGKITRQEFVDYFEINQLSIGAAFVNSAKKGQPASMRQIWGKDIAFLYLDKMVTRTEFGGLTWGFSPTFGARIAGTIEDPDIGLNGGQVVRVGEMTTETVVAKAAGALVTNVIS
jgi:hypothetical protein